MKVIDARSGDELVPGQIVEWSDGEWMRLESVDSGLFSATAVITLRVMDPRTGTFVTTRRTQPLIVRWLHPGFLFQHVAFIPS